MSNADHVPRRERFTFKDTFPSVSSQFAEYKHRNLHSLVRYIYVY